MNFYKVERHAGKRIINLNFKVVNFQGWKSYQENSSLNNESTNPLHQSVFLRGILTFFYHRLRIVITRGGNLFNFTLIL